jgi:hypothetical protein
LIALTEDIQKSVAINGIYLERVLYGLQDASLTTRILESSDVIQKFAETLISMLQDRRELKGVTAETLGRFVALICCAKHPDFRDEREVRLVVQEALVGLENGRPRAEQPAAERIVVKYLDALEEVMIGPSENQEHIVTKVRGVLDEAGFTHVRLTTSQIKFRFL